MVWAGNDILIGLGGDDILNGGTGNDTVDYHLNSDAVTIVLTETGGTASSVSGGNDTLVSIENVIGSDFADDITGNSGANRINGGKGNDTLRGGAGSDTYVFNADWGEDIVIELDKTGVDVLDFSALTDAVTFTIYEAEITAENGANKVTVSGTFLENLLGGQGDDEYVFMDKSVLPGVLDGGQGTNSISLSNSLSAVVVTLTDGAQYLGFNGVIVGSLENGFFNIAEIVGSAVSTTDIFKGLDKDSDWTISSAGMVYSYNTKTIMFSGFEILQGGTAADTFTISGTVGPVDLLGGAGNDTFIFLDEAVLEGNLDGQDGMNTLDYSAYQTPRNFHLTGLGSDAGFNGTEASIISGEFMNISVILGGEEVDSLSGLDTVSTWNMTGSGTYQTEGVTLYHDGIETFNGGALKDTFVFNDGVSIGGNIDGRGGSDTLDFSKYTSELYVNLGSGVASNIAGGITSIENVLGGKGDDILYGNNKSNYLSGGAGSDQLYGMGGDDTLNGGSGNDSLYGGDGSDSAYDPQIPGDYLDSIEFFLYPPVSVKGGFGTAGILVTGSVLRPDIISILEGEQYNLLFQNMTILALDIDGLRNVWNADFIVLPSGFASSVVFGRLSENDLPGALPEGTTFLRGLNLASNHDAMGANGSAGPVVIDFLISPDLMTKDLAILVWDPDMNGGSGGWQEVDFTVICCSKTVGYDGTVVHYSIESIQDEGDGWLLVLMKVDYIDPSGRILDSVEVTLRIEEDALLNGLDSGKSSPLMIGTGLAGNNFNIYSAVTDYLLSGLYGQGGENPQRDGVRLAVETEYPDYVVLVEKAQ